MSDLPDPEGALFISNGAGEDALGAVLARGLSGLRVQALPLVGLGAAWEGVAERVGPTRELPSGGLVPESLTNLGRDLLGGLPALMARQLRFLARHPSRVTVAVGDLMPVVLAGLAGRRPLLFVGTAKSSLHHPYSALEAWALKTCCALCLVRDELTAGALRARGVPARWVGNVMMDGLEPTGAELGVEPGAPGLALLPGSRAGTYQALPRMLEAYRRLAGSSSPAPRALVALAPGVDPRRLGEACQGWGWRETGRERGAVAFLEGPAPPVALVKGAFPDVLARCQVAFGLAGTAHEQAAGLGLPVVAYEPGGESRLGWYRGRQKGLLGEALLVLEDDPEEIARALARLFADPEERRRRGGEGRRRMGPPGATEAIARLIGEAACRGERT